MDDLISRQQAIDALRTCYDTETITMDNGDEYINYGDAVGEIEQLPSAEPQRIMGRWITDKQGFVTWSAICNKCGTRTQMLDGYYNFCPHCGAKMEVTT